MAFCTREKIEKPDDAFPPSTAKKGRGWCTACFTAAARRNRQGLRASEPVPRTCEASGCDVDISDRNAQARFCSAACNARGWRSTHEWRRREYYMKCVYGITQEEFVALLDAQGGVCAICGETPALTRGNKIDQWNVDHDHETNTVRGILCSRCNIGIGQLGDDVERLRAAIRYLERYSVAELEREPLDHSPRLVAAVAADLVRE